MSCCKNCATRGNTVIVVEHDPDVIKVADHIIDVGPHAGRQGGEIVFEGSYKDLLRGDTLTGKHSKQTIPLKVEFRKPRGKLPVRNARVNNLQNISVDIPTGVLTGAGASGLSND
jgi:excinuclease UvrABC ATPase subunit